jgi:hypothetical protein
MDEPPFSRNDEVPNGIFIIIKPYEQEEWNLHRECTLPIIQVF